MLIKCAVTCLCLSWCCALWTGCGRAQPRWQTYEEISTSAPAPRLAASPARPAGNRTSGSLQWTVPDGWRVEAASGMRLATFVVGSGEQTGTCTIVTLGGAAGGLDANVRRWLRQLNLQDPEPEAWTSFLAAQPRLRSEGGFEGVVADLTSLGPQAPETPSMLAGLFTVESSTVFVKLTGPLSLLGAEKENFTQLCQSLRSTP